MTVSLHFKTACCAIFSLFAATVALAQEDAPYHLNFSPCFNLEEFDVDQMALEAPTFDLAGQPITIETFRCYISAIELISNGQPVWTEPNSFHLLDASQPATLELALRAPENLSFDSVRFILGIDSLTNTAGVMGGDLDPTKGMYWAWNSGYINFKVEGTSALCPTRNNRFQYHLGGYLAPHQSAQQVTLDMPSRSPVFAIDLGMLLDGLDLTSQHTIMSPGVTAVALSNKAADIFYLLSAE